MEKIGTNLKLLRENKGFKQSEVCELVGVERSTWSNYENDKSEPNIFTLCRIAEVFEVPIEWLFLRNAHLMGKLDTLEKQGESTAISTANSTANYQKEGQNRIVNETKEEYKSGFTEFQMQTMNTALREIVRSQQQLIDSLNAQNLSLRDHIKKLEKDALSDK